MKKALCLFEGIGSSKKVLESMGYEVVCVEIEKKYNPTILSDIMEWNYEDSIYNPNDFDIITASPVCLYWSILRNTWIGRRCKKINSTEIITKKHILDDIDKYGKPMVDRTLEIIDYFKPKYWWIENPNGSLMWKYINEKYNHLNFETYIFDYCKYADYGFKKPTRFITNYKGVETLRCNKDCESIITIKTEMKEQKIHSGRMGTSKTIKTEEGKIIRCNSKVLREKYKDYQNIQQKIPKSFSLIGRIIGGSTKEERYRIPPKIIKELLKPIQMSL